MTTVVYDGSFDGLLTSIFEIYEYKFPEVMLAPEATLQHGLFGNQHPVTTDEKKAERVWKGFKQKVSPEAVQQVYKSWLSEQPGMDYTIYSYLKYAFESKTSIEKDYSHPAVLIISDTAKKVHREKHRMEAFIRFQLTKDQLYFAIIEPDFDVLPLIKKHFEARYADQRWMVYDARRRYGLYYDLEKVDTVNVNFEETNQSGKFISAIYDEKEELYQKLWQRYFASVNIKARRNMKLHIQHMPLRYWKYLTEKQP